MTPPLPRATLLHTEVHNFSSAIMQYDYQISAWFPPEYPKARKKYPVIYLLDADVLMGEISAIVFGRIWGKLMPECLIVGIGHSVSTLDEWGKIRDIEFTPEEDPDIAPPKRAADFLSFIKHELIPFVEITYSINPADRCLIGYSGSGEFALFTLLHEPELFQKYMICSAFWPNMLPHYLDYEEQLAKQCKSLPVHAYFSVGAYEDDSIPCLRQFVETLKNRKYPGLQVDSLVLEGEKHIITSPPAYSYGLQALYQPDYSS